MPPAPPLAPPPCPPTLRRAFRGRFARPPALAVRAPGRVNLIGEHTDYSEGLVLPCAIDRDTAVAAAPRSDGRVRAVACDLGRAGSFEAAAPRRRGDWLDYVMGPFFALAEAGRPAGGLELAIASRVPREAGLSSSAALGVAVAAAISHAEGRGLGAEALARVAHRGESAFVGVGCGILDHFASALGRRDCALRIDCRTQELRPVPLGPEIRLLVAHSGVRRALAAGAYRERVEECARAFRAAREAGLAPEGARTLRDLAPEALPSLERALPEALFRRARHVVSENARVDAFAAALEAGALERAGALLREAMASLRVDFAVSTPELDHLCAVGDAQPGCYGSRLTGAGFGGCTLHLVRQETAGSVGEALAAGFAERFGRRPEVWGVRAADGAGALAL